MKQILLFIGAALITSTTFGQNCTIDPQYANSSPGLYPDGPLGPSCELTAAKTIVSLTDTLIDTGTLGIITAYIDQLKVDSVYGLPSGLELHTDVEVDPQNYDWGIYVNTGTVPNQESATGCAYISGAQGAWDAAIGGGPNNDGEYPLVFVIDARIIDTDNPTANFVLGPPAWVSGLSPSFGGGRFYILDTLVVESDYADLEATISGDANVAPSTGYTYSTPMSPGATYNWIATNGTIISGQGTNEVVVEWAGSGNIQVDLTESNCSGSDNMDVTATATGLDEVAGINASVYPNPSNGIFTLRLESTDAMTISIMDVTGKMVRTEQLSGATLYNIDLRNAPIGVYVMEIQTAEGRTFKRLVKN